MNENYKDEAYFIGMNISTANAHYAIRSKKISRVSRGVFFRADLDAERLFDIYGIRIAHYTFPKAALTHSTAFYKRPTHGCVFIGGDFPYRKAVAQYAGDFKIVQSKVSIKGSHPDRLLDPQMYELVEFEDSFGRFEMRCATEEMVILQLMDASKKMVEKNVAMMDFDALLDRLCQKYSGKGPLLVALEEIAMKAGKENQFYRFLMYCFRKRTSFRRKREVYP